MTSPFYKLRDLGYTGTLNDMIVSYYRDMGSPYKQLNDAEMWWLEYLYGNQFISKNDYYRIQGGLYEDIASPIDLFSNSEQGVWYDPSDFSTMFQDAAGTTPVTAVEQPVGLILDKSKRLVLGPELVTNGDFSNGTTGWTAYQNSSLSAANGELTVTATGVSFPTVRQTITTVSGKRYFIYVNIKRNIGTLPVAVANAGSTNYQTTTSSVYVQLVYSFVANASSTNIDVFFVGTNVSIGDSFSIDNISIRELPGNHAFQGTSASRPVLSALVNLLTGTESISLFSTSNATISGSIFTVTAAGAANINRIYSVSSQPSGISFTTSVKLKRVNADWAAIQVYNINNTVGALCYVNLDTGVLGSSNVGSLGGTVSLTPIAGEVKAYRLSVTLPSNSAFSSPHIFVRGASANGNLNCVGGERYEVGQFDLRATNMGVGLPAYQRVNTSTDYDTAGFPHYLLFDGVDDFLQTNSINFTATDKMTVVAGVRKLSVAATATLFETSSSIINNNGTLFFGSPTSTNSYQFNSKGSSESIAGSGNGVYVAPITNVVAGISDISGDSVILRVNGNQVAQSTTDQGTGNYGNYPLYIGRRGGTTLPFKGQLFGLVIRGALSSTVEIKQIEAYMNSNTGAYHV